MNRIDRLFGILLLLQSRRLVRASEIAERYSISERTVYRDMAALMQLGVPIVSQAGEGYQILEGYYLPPLVFTREEAKALFLGVNMLSATGNLPQDAANVVDKLKQAIPKPILRDTLPQVDIIQFFKQQGSIDINDNLLITLQRAISEKRVLWLRYRGWRSDDTTEREIEPFSLTYGTGVWYVSAYCRLRQAVRDFRIDRIEDYRTLLETFTTDHHAPPAPPPDIDITLRFQIAMRRWVDEQQHYGFVDATPDDDHVLMRYRVHTLNEITGWILHWGAQVQVISPDHLKQHLRDELKSMLTLLT